MASSLRPEVFESMVGGVRDRRVLQVVLSLNPGGTERLVVELVRRLNRDIPMAVCCLDTPGAWASQITACGVEVRSLGRRPGFRPMLGRTIAAMARAVGANVLHCHHYSPFVYGCLSRAFRPASRVVYTEHGRLSDEPASRKRRLANRALAPWANAVFAVSRELGEQMMSEGFAPSSVETIYNGIDVGEPVTTTARAQARVSPGWRTTRL